MTPSGYGGYPARPAELYPITRGVVDVSGIPEGHKEIFADYERNARSVFVGLTSDGTPHPELYPLEQTGLSTDDIARRAREFLAALDDEQRAAAHLPIDSDRWRAWINAFAPAPPHGVLLDDLDDGQRAAAMAVIESALSEHGFELVRGAMRTNEALAIVAGGYEDTLREYVYWFTIFGDPEPGRPWGFQMYGHHSCLHVFVIDGQVTVGPMFVGAEPRIVEEGPFRGTRSFDEEMRRGIAVMQALTPEQQSRATLAPTLASADLPVELQHPTEGRMQGSAARDNAVVPYEGVPGAELDDEARARLLSLLELYVTRVRDDQARLRMRQVADHLDETWFVWAGEVALDRPFYYRVHSPVLFVELDAHSGIFIANDEPEAFHIHNIMRTPNGNDYGRAWLAQYDAARHEA